MNAGTILAVLGAVALAAVASAAAAAEAWPLEPVATVARVEFAGRPLDLEVRDGHLYLLDPVEQAIWVLDPVTGARQALDLPSSGATGMFFGCGDVLHVVDPVERSLFALEPGESVWRRRELGYRVFHGAGDDRAIVFNADRRHDAHLVAGAICEGAALALGERWEHPHPYRSVANNLNYSRLAVGSDLVAVGHIAVGRLQVFARGGNRLSDFDLTGPEVEQMRRIYLANLGLPAAAGPVVARDTLVADLIRGAQPERFPVPVYVNDLAITAGLLYVLVNNTLQILTPRGRLLARRPIAGEDGGERVILHAVCVTPEGRLYGLDTVHYRKVYDFGPAAGLAAVRHEDRDEEDSETGREQNR